MNESAEFTIGVEEEYQIINPQTRELCGKAEQIIRNARETLDEDVVQPEMYRSQIEIATTVCQNLAEARQELIRCRQAVVEAAKKQDQAIAAAGTHPFSSWQEQEITPKSRYRNLESDLKQVIRELIIFGNHVHAVTMAGLIRALVWTCYQEVVNDIPLNAIRPELLQTAHWYAARYGLTADLIDVIDKVAIPASDLVNKFLDYLQPALEQFGDWDTISKSVRHILEQGNGAQRQLAIYEKTGSYQDVVDYIVAQTKQD